MKPEKTHHGETEARRTRRENTEFAFHSLFPERPPRILYVAYPLLTVSEESAGGAEQILWTLEREMARSGMKTTVAASAGSRITGSLFATGEPCRELDDFERRNREHQEKILRLIARRQREGRPFDLIHDMSGNFWPCANTTDVPVLATLHLPRSFYPSTLFTNLPANVLFNCVSYSQARWFADLNPRPEVVANGIVFDSFLSLLSMERSTEEGSADNHRRAGLLWLGRICEEKAPHLALEIAERAGLEITIAGQVYPFSYHQEYFAREIAPRLRRAPQTRFIKSPSAEIKRRLLRDAQALLITSQVEETSSLVAMESAASGTPVVALARGALVEVVRDGLTGFLVDDPAQAVQALATVREIRRDACIDYARRHFSSTTMADGYAGLYARILEQSLLSVARQEFSR